MTILPTLVVNNRQYRGQSRKLALLTLISELWLMLMYEISGKLEKGAVLKAICAGFEETTEPAVCLSSGEH